eukprot:m.174846 g.174846  ORF g.174846 m.174846 type:complete len:653 (+) comp16758_c0_seq5:27-1985(+)
MQFKQRLLIGGSALCIFLILSAIVRRRSLPGTHRQARDLFSAESGYFASRPSSLSYDKDNFLLKGSPFKIWSGSLHYFRIPEPYWRDRLLKLKQLGLNTVSTYIPWNFHETAYGEFDFETKERNLARFVSLAQDVGLYVLLRPSPYICAEWTFGGLPSRLMANDYLHIRSNNSEYLREVAMYYDNLMPVISPLQMMNGGPVIGFYVENEFGSYDNDPAYMQWLVHNLRTRGLHEMLFTCDNAGGLRDGMVKGALQTVNFQDKAAKHLGALAAAQPNAPLMVSEYWTGWFDHWDEKQHHLYSSEDVVDGLRQILALKASFNLYVFHGGTTFGFYQGANMAGAYAPDTTSYDYDALLNEHGGVTAKFGAVQKLLVEYGGQALPYDSLTSEPKVRAAVPIAQEMDLLKVLAKGKHAFPVYTHQRLKFVEDVPLHQAYGYTLFSAHVAQPAARLFIKDFKDSVAVYVDGVRLATRERWKVRRNTVALELAQTKPFNLSILVEDAGRVNYGQGLGERKGMGMVELMDSQGQLVVLGDHPWTITPMHWHPHEVEALPWTRAQLQTTDSTTMRVAKANLQIQSVGTENDTYIDTRGWGRGVVFLNGINLGRFDGDGPQFHIYLPGCWLRQGTNELVILDVRRSSAVSEVRFSAEPIWQL